jgi:ribose transport system substrate-binding protein
MSEELSDGGIKASRLSDELLRTANEIRRHPAYGTTLSLFATEYPGTFRGTSLLSKIATTEARHLICGHMVALHYRRDVHDPGSGIVLSRLQAFARRHRLASPGRVASLVCVMRHAGYLRAVRGQDCDRRLVVLEPTEAAAEAVRSYVQPFLRAFDRLNGNDRLEAQLARDDTLKDALLAHALDIYCDGGALLDIVPQMRLFSERDAGYEILLCLWAAFDKARASRSETISFPFGRVARSFGVSRTHVRKLVEVAAREGYLELRSERECLVAMRPSFRELIELFVSLHLAVYHRAIARVDVERGHASQELAGERCGLDHGADFGTGATLLRIGRLKSAGQREFALSVPFATQESFRRIIAGYQDAVDRLGGKLTVVEAGWNVERQAEQIAALVGQRPDALFVVPTDPARLRAPIEAATDRGVPIFLCDSYVPGTAVRSISMHDHFKMGAAAAEYICRRLQGQGTIAVVSLRSNAAWDMRRQGLELVLSRYPGIKIVAEWPFALTGQVTPRQAVEALLARHPQIDAIWSAWDGAAKGAAEALAAAGRTDVFVTGIDGGEEAFDYIRSGSAFCFTVAQSFYEQVWFNVHYAHEMLAGREVPLIVINPAFAVSRELLPDKIPEGYDRPGVADRLGWPRVRL